MPRTRIRNVFFTMLMTCSVLFFAASAQNAAAQQEDGGLFSGLFNKDASEVKPLYVKPSTAGQKQTYTGGGASTTGVAKPSATSGGSAPLYNYQNVTKSQMDKMSTGELIQMEAERQMATTKQFRENKVKEAEEMAAIYRAQMEERLASQMEDPSALQSMGAGGMGGVSEEQIKRKMIYKPKDEETTGKKPIRLFDVR